MDTQKEEPHDVPLTKIIKDIIQGPCLAREVCMDLAPTIPSNYFLCVSNCSLPSCSAPLLSVGGLVDVRTLSEPKYLPVPRLHGPGSRRGQES